MHTHKHSTYTILSYILFHVSAAKFSINIVLFPTCSHTTTRLKCADGEMFRWSSELGAQVHVVQWDVGFGSIQLWSPHGGQYLSSLSEVALATDDEPHTHTLSTLCIKMLSSDRRRCHAPLHVQKVGDSDQLPCGLHVTILT